MQFLLTGFRDDQGFRVFSFQGVATDRTRSVYSVRADIAVIRNYGIRVQELPLMCRALLEVREGIGQERAFTFTEEDMRLHAASCAAERDAVQRKRANRKIPTTLPGSGWRVPQPQ